jgi:UDP-glucose 4-epimerase
VLGGGQVGTFAARAIAEQGGAVTTADAEPLPEYFARFGPQPAGVLVRADIRHYTALTALLQQSGADVIVLAAGMTHAACASDARTAWRVNVDGARTVARAALDHRVKRLVFVSSFDVYGRPSVDQMPESLPLSTKSVYGRTKVAAETALCSLRSRGLDVRVLRPCGLFGPVRAGGGSRSAQLITLLLLYAVNGRPLTIDAEGTLPDEYLYIKDLAGAIARAALGEHDVEHAVFNVGSGRTTTIEDLCAAVRAVVPTAQFTINSRPGRPRSAAPLDISRVRDSLGFEPRYSLVEGLADYVHADSGLQL